MGPQQGSLNTVSLQTRVKVWWESLPLITRSVFAVCVALYVVGLLVGVDRQELSALCLSPERTVQGLQVYRLATALVFHVGILHLAFNMLAFLPTGKALERQLGSVQFGALLATLALVGDVMYLTLAYCAALLPSLGNGMLHSCAVGLSGVLFALVVVENQVSRAKQRSVLGCFVVPARAYPWVLLVAWQLLMPGVSFLGHLCGVLAGELYAAGYLDRLKLSPAAVQRVEQSALCGRCVGMAAFMSHGAQLPVSVPGGGGHSGDSSSGVAVLHEWLQSMRRGAATYQPLPTAEPSTPGGSGEAQTSLRGPFKGRGYKLSDGESGGQAGGTEISSVDVDLEASTTSSAVPPDAATLAAAAEARLGRYSQHGAGSAAAGARGGGVKP